MQSSGATQICYAVLPPGREVSRLLWHEGIEPVFDSPDLRDRFRCILSDDVYSVGVVLDGIRRLIERASLVIADLTGRDPSVTLQAGIAAALGKPIVVLLADTASMDDVPFDWQTSPIIRYPAGDPAGSQLGLALRATISERSDRQTGADVQQLLAQLVSDDRQTRREAEETLGRMAEPSTIRPLYDLLASPDARVRASAGLALRRMGGPQVTEVLLEALMDERAYVRRTAAWVLRELHDESVVGALVQRLSDRVPVVRQTAAWTLGELHARSAAGLLVRLLDDEDADVRRGAADASGSWPMPRPARPLLPPCATPTAWSGKRPPPRSGPQRPVRRRPADLRNSRRGLDGAPVGSASFGSDRKLGGVRGAQIPARGHQ